MKIQFKNLEEKLREVAFEAVVESCMNEHGTRVDIDVNLENGEVTNSLMQQNSYCRPDAKIFTYAVPCSLHDLQGFVCNEVDGLYYNEDEVEYDDEGEASFEGLEGLDDEDVIRNYFADDILEGFIDELEFQVKEALDDYNQLNWSDYEFIIEELNEENVAYANLKYYEYDTKETFRDKLVDFIVGPNKDGDMSEFYTEDELESMVDKMINEIELSEGIYDIIGIASGNEDFHLMRIEDIIALEVKFGEHDLDYFWDFKSKARRQNVKELLIEYGFLTK